MKKNTHTTPTALRLFSFTASTKRSTALRLYGSTAGQTLMELLLALGLFAFIMTAVFVLVFGGLTTGLRTEEQDYATMYAQEGLDAARSIRDRDWGSFVSAANGKTHGVNTEANYWVWDSPIDSETNDEMPFGARKFTREITVEDVYRDGNNNIFTGSNSANFDFNTDTQYAYDNAQVKFTGTVAQLKGNGARLDNSVNPKELAADPTYTKALYHFNATTGAEANREGDELDIGVSGNLTDDDLGGASETNLKGLWHLNENTGTTTADTSGNSNTGSLLRDGTNWTKSGSNPVMSVGGASSWDVTHVVPGTVIKDGSTYKMWYTGYANATDVRIGYATSTDGIVWTRYDNTGAAACGFAEAYDDGCVLNKGATGMWDINQASIPIVIKESDTSYKMWYRGYNGTTYRIGYATSTDGIAWTRYDNTGSIACALTEATDDGCVMGVGVASSWDVSGVHVGGVIKESSTLYKMWYQGLSGTWKIGYATSTDGIVWTRYDNTGAAACGFAEAYDDGCIMSVGASGAIDDTGMLSTWVIKEGGVYKMWYGAYDNPNYRILYASSADGIIWTKPTSFTCDTYASTNCVLNRVASTWESSYVIFPTILDDNGIYKMWYAGYNGTNYKIGYAEAKPPTWTTAGKFSNALSFDGVDDYVSVPHNSSIEFATKNFSIEFWIKTTQTVPVGNGTYIAAKIGTTRKWNYSVMAQNPFKLQFQRDDGTNNPIITTAASYNDGNWHHVAVVDNGTINIYVDGASVASGADTTTAASTTTSQQLQIGSNGSLGGYTGNYFAGQLDEAAVYNTALSAPQITDHYRRGVAEDATNPASAFEANDGNIYSAITTTGNTNLNQALQFDGVDDYVSVPDSASFDMGSYTLEAWIKSSSAATQQRIVSHQDATQYWVMGLDSGRLRFCDNFELNCAFTTETVNDGAWHHVAVVRDIAISDKYKWYIDGVLKKTVTGTNTSVHNITQVVNIGRYNDGTQSFNGSIDEVAIWNKALTQAEIWDHVGANLGYAKNTYATVKRSASFPATDYIDKFKEFVETATKPAGTMIDYQLSTDNCVTMKYWDGTQWTNAGGWNDIRTINRYFDQFKPLSSTICLSARLNTTDTNQTPVLDNVEIKYSQSQGGAKLTNPTGIDAVQTTGITLSSVIGLPTSGSVTIDNEVITYTALSGNDLSGTVTRGANGTTAVSHLLNAEVKFTTLDSHTKRVASRVKWPSGFSFQDVSLTEYLTDWMYPKFVTDSYNDFNAFGHSPPEGMLLTFDSNGTLYLTATGMSSGGETYTSTSLDAGAPSKFLKAEWNATIQSKPGTSMWLQFRSTDIQANLQSAPWCGPTLCDWNDKYNITTDAGSVALNSIHNNHQYYQYQIRFVSSATDTPVLDKITIQAKNLY